MGGLIEYLIGTSKEISGLDEFDRNLSSLEEHVKRKEDGLLARRDMVNIEHQVDDVISDYEDAAKGVRDWKFDLMYYSTIVYAVASFALSFAAPYASLPFLADSLIRVSRMAFCKDRNPVGLVGTIREAYGKYMSKNTVPKIQIQNKKSKF